MSRSRAWLIAIVLLTAVSGLLSGLVLVRGDSLDHQMAIRPGWKRATSLLWFVGFLILLAALSILAAVGGAWLGETFPG